jgi:hypothetical protein
MKLQPMPESLFMEIPSYSMTGTLKGATAEQLATLIILMKHQGIDYLEEFFWHFGDAVGADTQAFFVVSEAFPFTCTSVAHPGDDSSQRGFCPATIIREPMKNLSRNRRIAYSGHQGLFALPKTAHEVLRSGTWTTVRNAGVGKLGRPTWIIAPDGTWKFYEKGYQTVLVKGILDRDELDTWGL